MDSSAKAIGGVVGGRSRNICKDYGDPPSCRLVRPNRRGIKSPDSDHHRQAQVDRWGIISGLRCADGPSVVTDTTRRTAGGRPAVPAA